MENSTNKFDIFDQYQPFNKDRPNLYSLIPGFSYAGTDPTLPEKVAPETVQIKFGGKIHNIKYEHWNMIKYLGLNKFYCMICRFGNEKRIMIDHCKSEIHQDNMLKCGVVATGDNFFVRKAHTGMYHCGHCNNMQQTIDMDVHMQKYNLKITKTTNENHFLEFRNFSDAIKLQKEIKDHDKENINNNSLTNINVTNLDTVEILSTKNNNVMMNNNNDKGSSLNQISESIRHSLTKSDNEAEMKYPDKTLKHILQQETNTTENYSKILKISLKQEKEIKNEENKTNSEYPDTTKILNMTKNKAILYTNDENCSPLYRSLDSIKELSNKNDKHVDEKIDPNKTFKNIFEKETDLSQAENCDEIQEQSLKQMKQNINVEIKTNIQTENLETVKNLSVRNDNSMINNNNEEDASLNRSLDSIKDMSNKIIKQVDQEVNPNITIKKSLHQDSNLNNSENGAENDEKLTKQLKEITKEENISDQSTAPKRNNNNIKVLEISKCDSNISLKQEIKTSRNDTNDRFSTEKNNGTQNLNKAKTSRCTSEQLTDKNNMKTNIAHLDNSRVKSVQVSNTSTVKVNNIENNSNQRIKKKKKKSKGGNCIQKLSPISKQKPIFTNILESGASLPVNGNKNHQNKRVDENNILNEQKNVKKNKTQKEALNNLKIDDIKNNINYSVDIFKSVDQFETETQVEDVCIENDVNLIDAHVDQSQKSYLPHKEIKKHEENNTKKKDPINITNNESVEDIFCKINNEVQNISKEGKQENDNHLNEELDNNDILLQNDSNKKHDENKEILEKKVKIEGTSKQQPEEKHQSEDENTLLPNINTSLTNNTTKNDTLTRNIEMNTRSNYILEHVLNAIESEKNNSVLEFNVNNLAKSLADIKVRFEKQEANIKSLQKNNPNLCEKHREAGNSDSEDEIVTVDEVDELCSEMDRVKSGLNNTLIHLKKRVRIMKDCEGKELNIYKDSVLDEQKKIYAKTINDEENLDDKLNEKNLLIEKAKISMNAELNTNIFFKEIKNDKKVKVKNDIEEAHKIVLDSLMQIKCKLLDRDMHSYSSDTLETTKLDLSMLKKGVKTNFNHEVDTHSEAVGEIKIDEGNKNNLVFKNKNVRIGNLDISITTNTYIENNKSTLNTIQSKVDKKIVDETKTKNEILLNSVKTDINSLIEFTQMPNNSIYFVYFVTRMTTVINVFDRKLTVTYMSLNTIKETMINLKCVACGTAFHDDQLVKHLVGTQHLHQVKKFGFMTEYSINAIRKIDKHFHCAICNLLLPANPSIALLHNTTIEHRILLQKAFEFEHNETHKTLNLDTDTNLDTEQIATISNNLGDEIKKEISKCDILSKNIPAEIKCNEHTRNTLTNNNCENNVKRDDETNPNEYNPISKTGRESLNHFVETSSSKDLYVIANLCDVYIKLNMEAWHTLIQTVDDDLFCFVCDELALFGRILSENLLKGKHTYYKVIKKHTETKDHYQNLIKYKILTDFNTNMIRERSIHCHCAICNLACLKTDIVAHLKSDSHIENHRKSIFLNVTLLDRTADYIRVNVLTQKMAPINETKDPGVDNNVDDNVEMTFKVMIPVNNWQGIVSTPNGFRCFLCNVNFKKKLYEQHIYGRPHDNRVENRQFEEYQDDLIYKLDTKRMHCILCNIELAPIDVATHIKGKRHKDNKMAILKK